MTELLETLLDDPEVAAERWRALADNSLDTVIVVERDGTIIYVNRSLAGGPRERYAGTPVFEHAPPDARGDILAALREVFDEGATVRLVLTGYGRGGSPAWYEHRCCPIRRDGRIVQALIVSTDVTHHHDAAEALRRSEAQHRLLFEDSPLPMWVVDRETLRFLAVNEAAVRQYGYARDEFLAMRITDIRPPEEVPALLKVLAERPRNVYEAHGEWAHRRKNGTILHTEVVRHTITFAGREAWLATVVDVTERRRVTDAMDRSRRQLEALSRRLLEAEENERRRIARELHDDAGQAMTSLLLGLKKLESATDLATAHESARKLRRMCAHVVRDLSQLARGLHPPLLDDLGLHAALRRLGAEHMDLHGIQVAIAADELNGCVPLTVQTALFRIAQEACGNSARAGQPRRIDVSVRLLNGSIELEVKDDGTGFDVERVSAEAAQSGRLGLVSMRERAALLGGTLTIRSQAGSGTVVMAAIPLPQAAATLPGAPGVLDPVSRHERHYRNEC